MAKVLQPLFARGYFQELVIDRNRLYSQLLDNLNKAAVVGFSHRDISSRLKDAWIGKPDQLIHYDQAQECIDLVRAYGLENNLLDYSLQLRHSPSIVAVPPRRQYFRSVSASDL